jgi:hypothetical protein
MGGGRLGALIPGYLPVIMSVYVHKPRRNEQARGVDLLGADRNLSADLDDPGTDNRDIANKGFAAAPVDNGAAAENNICGFFH